MNDNEKYTEIRLTPIGRRKDGSHRAYKYLDAAGHEWTANENGAYSSKTCRSGKPAKLVRS